MVMPVQDGGPGAGNTGAWASPVGMCRVGVRSGPGTGLPCRGNGVDGAQRAVLGAWASFGGRVPGLPQGKGCWAWRGLRLESPRVSRARPRTPPRLAPPSYLGAAARVGGARWAGGGPGSCRRHGAADRGGGVAAVAAAAPNSGRGPRGRRGCRAPAPAGTGVRSPFHPAPLRPARAASGRPAPAVFLRAAGHALPLDLHQGASAAPSGTYAGSAPPPFPGPPIPISHRISVPES